MIPRRQRQSSSFSPVTISRLASRGESPVMRPQAVRGGHVTRRVEDQTYYLEMTEARSRTLSRAVAMAGALPLVWLASLSLVRELPRLVVDDPCFLWGQSNGSTLTVGTPPCELSAGGTSETKTAALIRLSRCSRPRPPPRVPTRRFSGSSSRPASRFPWSTTDQERCSTGRSR